jgi:hypothetical protein
MKKCNYHFYTEDEKGNRKYVHIGAYKQPARTDVWKSLKAKFEDGKVAAIGFEASFTCD